MSSIVCQGLQSCLVEPTAVRLKLAPPPSSNFSPSSEWSHRPSTPDSDPHPNHHDNNSNHKTENGDVNRGWSFMENLLNTSKNSKEEIDNKEVYVHPLHKRSATRVGEISLEMCTENLGSETGSDITQSSWENAKSPAKERSKFKEISRKKLDRSATFPPPLTSISGFGCVQVRPHREEGRLVLKAVTVSSCNTYFHAERSDGRLRLRLLKDCSSEIIDSAEAEAEEEAEEEGGDDEEEAGDETGEAEGEGELEGEGSESECVHSWGNEEGELEGNCGNVGGKMGRRSVGRPNRCKQEGCGNKEMYTRPFWVATS
ncbi:protein FANTASTIC FOUR 1-like [Malania oleifera]|uniref:protein FANTASTIC FOUR 1-like n=1 Tax=Malania oleifera TaxID=397392 RepID=UPI0025AEA3FF|nr:protein FANTASTIC FOUR 1-like [Malania oleifera]